MVTTRFLVHSACKHARDQYTCRRDFFGEPHISKAYHYKYAFCMFTNSREFPSKAIPQWEQNPL